MRGGLGCASFVRAVGIRDDGRSVVAMRLPSATWPCSLVHLVRQRHRNSRRPRACKRPRKLNFARRNSSVPRSRGVCWNRGEHQFHRNSRRNRSNFLQLPFVHSESRKSTVAEVPNSGGPARCSDSKRKGASNQLRASDVCPSSRMLSSHAPKPGWVLSTPEHQDVAFEPKFL